MARKKGGERRSWQQPNAWVAFSVVFLISVFTVVTLLGPSTVTGNTIQDIGRMTKGEPLHLAVKDVPGLELIFTNAAETIKNGKILVEVDESIPFDRAYVTKFNVTSVGKFGPLQFTFKVKEQDLYDLGIGQYDLRLHHKSEEYSLQLLKQNYGYFYYVVTVPEMGKFVLGRVAVEEPAAVAGTKPEEALPEAEAPAVEEPAAEEEAPVVGKAVELPEYKERKGFWARIADFFRNLFK